MDFSQSEARKSFLLNYTPSAWGTLYMEGEAEEEGWTQDSNLAKDVILCPRSWPDGQ